jgi:hypothetical protein
MIVISIVINIVIGVYIVFIIPNRLSSIKKGIANNLKDSKKIYDVIRGVGNDTINK